MEFKKIIRLVLSVGLLLLMGMITLFSSEASAIGDASTRFNMYVPGNNAYSSRRVFLIVTNVSPDSASVDIIDDGTDGDSDDTAMGITLVQGQSYIVKMSDGAVNDDYGGKNDGDYFMVEASVPVVVQMATQSNWQHDWAPSVDKDSRGTDFFIYAPQTSGADNDINVFSYSDNTTVSVIDITASLVSNTSGYTDVDISTGQSVLNITLHEGEDLIVRENKLGLDILDPGHTYRIMADKAVTVQYGHLGQVSGGNQARDGAGFVPGADGSTTSSLYYFSIPHNPGFEREKELRIACFDNSTTVTLDASTSSSPVWSQISQQTIDAGEHLDFTGQADANFKNGELYRLTIAPSYHRCTVFEGNWLETGSFGTSDFASAVSSRSGKNVGYQFTAYIGPPGKQGNVAHPQGELTNNSSPVNGYASHLYLYAYHDNTLIDVKDSDTSGSIISHSVTIDKGEYFDMVIDRNEYISLSSNGNRPYINVNGNKPIMVMNGNFNDNWMASLYSVVEPFPVVGIELTEEQLSCGETVDIDVTCDNTYGYGLSSVTASLWLPSNLTPVSISDSGQVTGDTVTWSPSALDVNETLSFTVTAQLSCSTCLEEELSPLSFRCGGVATDGVPYEAVQVGNIELRASSPVDVGTFTVMDIPDYSSSQSDPRVEVNLAMTGGTPGSTTVKLLRANNSPDPDASMTTLTEFAKDSGPFTLSYDDGYTQHLGITRYYRLEIEQDGCTRTVGPVAVQTSSGASGGEDSGLESNGRLSTKLARRTIVRSIARKSNNLPVPFQLYDSVGQPYDPTSTLVGNDFNHLIPDVGPKESEPYVVTPVDLPKYTNAKRVLAVDYRTPKGELEISALFTETVGEIYEHSKMECDRAKGGTIPFIEHTVEEEGSLVRFASSNLALRTGEYGVSFKLYETGPMKYELHNHWMRSAYPKPEDGQRVINVQLWSSTAGHELTLLRKILDDNDVLFKSSGDLPGAWFYEAEMFGTITEAVVNLNGDEKFMIRATRLMENGEIEVSKHSLDSTGVWQQNDIISLDVTLELVDSKGETVDRVWVSDGAWSTYDDSLTGGSTNVVDFNTTPCPKREGSFNPDNLYLSGCASVSGDVDQYIGVARHLGGGLGMLVVNDYSTISFVGTFSGPFEICLEGSSKNPGRFCAKPEHKTGSYNYQLSLDDFKNPTTCKSIDSESLNLVTFTINSKDGSDVGELSVSKLTFEKVKSLTNHKVSICKVGAQNELPPSGCSSCTVGVNSGGTRIEEVLFLLFVALLWLFTRLCITKKG